MSAYNLVLPAAPAAWTDVTDWSGFNWSRLPPLTPFIRADGGAPASQQTVTRVGANAKALFVHFACTDRDIWGTYTARDDPLYDEEVVELFLAPGSATPANYFEFEVSPLGVLFDAHIHNPDADRATLQVDASWDCPGLRWTARTWPDGQGWSAALIVPWTAVAPPGAPPRIWRANFYRIERPRDARPEFSCWSPTRTDPADFHVPAAFGTLIRPAETAS